MDKYTREEQVGQRASYQYLTRKGHFPESPPYILDVCLGKLREMIETWESKTEEQKRNCLLYGDHVRAFFFKKGEISSANLIKRYTDRLGVFPYDS